MLNIVATPDTTFKALSPPMITIRKLITCPRIIKMMLTTDKIRNFLNTTLRPPSGNAPAVISTAASMSLKISM